MISKPRMEITDIIAAASLYLGLLLFLVALHLLTINTVGDTSSMLNTVFIVFLRIYEALLLFGIVYLIIHFLRWMVWKITVPKWMRMNMQQGKGRFE